MLNITLKGGDVRQVAENTTVEALCRDISMGLYRAACAARVDGETVDLRTPLTRDCTVEILTFEDEEGCRAFISYDGEAVRIGSCRERRTGGSGVDPAEPETAPERAPETAFAD